MNSLRTTYRNEHGEITLGLSMSDLEHLISTGFSEDIGIFDNHSGAHGQDTTAWVTKSQSKVSSSVDAQHEHSEYMSPSLIQYFEALNCFLRNNSSSHIKIRHHYAWWHPKWFDLLLAGLR